MNSSRPIWLDVGHVVDRARRRLPRSPVTVLATTTATMPAPSTSPAMTASGRCADQRLGLEVVGPVDAEQHDHEQEQHDDGAGVDDDLHGGEEVARPAR